MFQATIANTTVVTMNEHVNGTFDVVYSNPKNGTVSVTDKLCWLNLILAVISGVTHQLGLNTYRDTADYIKARNFINALIQAFPVFSSLNVQDETDVKTPPCTVSVLETLLHLETQDSAVLVLLSQVLQAIHVSGSIAGKENPEEMSGLVTITYQFPSEEQVSKVRLSGKQIAEVGLALAGPYKSSKENGTLVIKSPEVRVKKEVVEDSKPETGGELRLAKDQLEQLANMVAEKLLFAMNRQNPNTRVKHPPKQPRVIAHVVKDRGADKVTARQDIRQ